MFVTFYLLLAQSAVTIHTGGFVVLGFIEGVTTRVNISVMDASAIYQSTLVDANKDFWAPQSFIISDMPKQSKNKTFNVTVTEILTHKVLVSREFQAENNVVILGTIKVRGTLLQLEKYTKVSGIEMSDYNMMFYPHTNKSSTVEKRRRMILEPPVQMKVNTSFLQYPLVILSQSFSHLERSICFKNLIKLNSAIILASLLVLFLLATVWDCCIMSTSGTHSGKKTRTRDSKILQRSALQNPVIKSSDKKDILDEATSDSEFFRILMQDQKFMMLSLREKY